MPGSTRWRSPGTFGRRKAGSAASCTGSRRSRRRRRKTQGAVARTGCPSPRICRAGSSSAAGRANSPSWPAAGAASPAGPSPGPCRARGTPARRSRSRCSPAGRSGRGRKAPPAPGPWPPPCRTSSARRASLLPSAGTGGSPRGGSKRSTSCTGCIFRGPILAPGWPCPAFRTWRCRAGRSRPPPPRTR